MLEGERGGRGFVGLRNKEGVRQAIPLCLMWCLWREQNDQCFEGQE